MDDSIQLRVEALRIAANAQPGASPEAIMLMAQEFLHWIMAGPRPELIQPELPLARKPINASRPPTIKAMIIDLLASAGPRGLTALQILDEIKGRWWSSLERTSLSPQLSRLKGDGLIAYVDGAYRLPTTADVLARIKEKRLAGNVTGGGTEILGEERSAEQY